MSVVASSLTAIIWDFDGTLADTRARNLNVTRRIVETLTGRGYAEFPMLRTVEAYQARVRLAENWRALYREEFGFEESVIDRAGSMWSECQLADDTPSTVFEGVEEVVRQLGAVPQGVVSQNAQEQIVRVLEGAGIAGYFGHIVGHEEVPPDRQKPAPDGLLICLEALTRLAPGRVVYLGDHDTDIRCAGAAQRALDRRGERVEILVVGAQFGAQAADWSVPPRHRVFSPGELLGLIAAL